MKKKVISILVVLFIVSIPFVAHAVDLASNYQQELMQSNNPYIKQYIEERGILVDDNGVSESTVQRASDLEILTEIYNQDIKVQNIIQKYTTNSSYDYLEKSTSLDLNQIIDSMHKIEIIYPLATEEEQGLMRSYLMHHAQACEDSQSIAFLESLNNTDPIQLSANYSYNPTSGVNYALNWWHRFNTSSYPALDKLPNSGDCTNFVSQCLKAGGVPFQSNWYCYKKNNNYPHPTTIAQLNNSWNLSDPSPWISIKPFTDYWYSRVSVKAYNLQQYKDRHADIFVTEIAKGDIVIFKSGVLGVNWPVHAMIISDYDGGNKDFLCAGHTNARNYYPILTALNDGAYSGVDFYLF